MKIGFEVKYGTRTGVIKNVDQNMRFGVEVEFHPDVENKAEVGYFDFQGNPSFKNPEFEGKLKVTKA